MSDVTCLRCGWVSFDVSRADAEDEVARFNAFFDTLTPLEQENYGGKSSIAHYEKCRSCGGSYKDFRPAIDGDAPNGVTMTSIIRATD